MIKMKKEKTEVSTCIQSTCLPSPCRLGLECSWISSWLSISGRQDPPRLRESDGSGDICSHISKRWRRALKIVRFSILGGALSPLRKRIVRNAFRDPMVVAM